MGDRCASSLPEVLVTDFHTTDSHAVASEVRADKIRRRAPMNACPHETAPDGYGTG